MFERGLPGYDAWLDNHGNPGMGDDMIHDWVFEDAIDVKQTKDDEYVITSADGDGDLVLVVTITRDGDVASDRRMLINGQDHDLGDDFIRFISIIDDFHEQYAGSLGMTVQMPAAER